MYVHFGATLSRIGMHKIRIFCSFVTEAEAAGFNDRSSNTACIDPQCVCGKSWTEARYTFETHTHSVVGIDVNERQYNSY